MPVFSALAFVTSAVASGLTTVGFSAAAAAAGANLIVGTGLSFASQLAIGRPKTPSQDYRATLNQATGARLSGYGRRRIGGTRAFFDSKNGALDQIVMLHHGRIDGFEKFWVGDTEVVLDADGWVRTRPWFNSDGSYLRIKSRVGNDTSPAYEDMLARWPGVWTSAHKLNGIATLHAYFADVGIEHFSKLFPNGSNTVVTATCRLRQVYDPRTRLTRWSDNPALCIADYLTSEDGFRLRSAQIDWPSVATFAADCDALVERKHGADEKRYRLSGMFSLQDDPKDVIARMRATCDCEFFLTTEGKLGMRGGTWEEPTVTIEDTDIFSYDLEQGNDRFSSFNELKITYFDAATDTTAEAPKWINRADQSVRGIIAAQIDFDMVESPSQAQRLAKIYQARQNPQWKGTISTTLAGLLARGQRTIRLVLPELGIDETFAITSHGIRADLTGCEIGISSLGPSAYVWNAATEEGVETPEPEDTRPDTELPVPAFELTSEVRAFTAGTSLPIIIATATASDRTSLTLQTESRLTPAGSFEFMTATGLRAVSGPVSAGEAYEVRARWATARGSAGDWSEPQTIAIPV